MNTHATIAPQYAALAPEPPISSFFGSVPGTLPKSTSIKSLRSAIAKFDGVLFDAMRLTYQPRYASTFSAMLDDLEAARRIVVEDDKTRTLNLGYYPARDDGTRISFYDSWRAPFGASLCFADFPNTRTTALVVLGSDAGRLTSITAFSLRTLPPRLTGRADGNKVESLMPFFHVAFIYVPDGNGGYVPTFVSDPEQRPRFMTMSKAAILLLERHRQRSQTAG